MGELTRRRALVGFGAVATAGLAGCSGSAEEDEPAAETGTRLETVAIENLDADDHTVDVVVEWNGEIDHWSTHELAGREGGVRLDGDWPTDAGSFRVTVRLDGEELTQASPDRWNDPDCLGLLVVVDRDGGLTIHGNTDCGAEPDVDD